MNYNKKISGLIVLLAISLAMITGVVYGMAKFATWFVYIFSIVISPLLGYLFTYKGTKNDNKFFMICSIFFYNIFISSIIGGWYSAKSIPIDLVEISYLSLGSFVLISIVYVLVAKCKSVVIPAFIGIVLMLIVAALVWKSLENSYINENSLVYSLAMFVLVVFHYIVALVAKNKDINIIKAISNGFGGVFWLIAAFATEGVAALPTSSDEKKNN